MDKRTVMNFGEEWSKFDHSDVNEQDLKKIFDEYFNIFSFEMLPSNSVCIDAGCGSGRWASFVAPKCSLLYALDASSEALNVARKNLSKFSNVKYLNSDICDIDLADNTLDFAYSLGVLHHIPNTYDGIKSIARCLKPGAPFLVYLYYKLDNKSKLYRYIWRISNLFRVGISRAPFWLRYIVSQTIAAFVYFPLARVSAALSRVGVTVESIPLSYYKDKKFYCMRTDALDRFGTPIEHRYTKQEIIEMLTKSGFKNIRFSESAPYWVALAFKDNNPSK